MSDLIERQAALDMEFSNGITEDGVLYVPWREVKMNLEELPSAQPELIEKAAYIRGFEQGRTQGMIDAQGGKK